MAELVIVPRILCNARHQYPIIRPADTAVSHDMSDTKPAIAS
jgi:hypothetical protein